MISPLGPLSRSRAESRIALKWMSKLTFCSFTAPREASYLVPGTDPSEKASCQTGLGNCGAWSFTSSTMISTCIIIVVLRHHTFLPVGLISLQWHRSFCDCHPGLFQRVYVRVGCARGGALHLYGRRISSLLPTLLPSSPRLQRANWPMSDTGIENGKDGRRHQLCIFTNIAMSSP